MGHGELEGDGEIDGMRRSARPEDSRSGDSAVAGWRGGLLCWCAPRRPGSLEYGGEFCGGLLVLK